MPEKKFLDPNITIRLINNRKDWISTRIITHRPIRITRDDRPVIILNGFANCFYKDIDGSFIVFTEEPTYLLNLVQIPKVPIQISEVPYYSEKLSILYNLFNKKIPFTLKKNDFGTYAYLDLSEDFIQNIILEIEKRKDLKLSQWEDVESTTVEKSPKLEWRFKFSQALLMQKLADFLIEVLVNINLKKQPEKLQTFGESIAEGVKALEPAPHQEKLSETAQKFGTVNETLIPAENNVENKVSSKSSTKRVSAERKFIRDLMFNSYKRLAVHPDSISNILSSATRFKAVTKTLSAVNAGSDYKFKKLQGRAGNAGWCEISEHIEDGQSKRLRIYFRKAPRISDCLEVYIQSKKNDKDQDRTLIKISKFSSAENREVVYL